MVKADNPMAQALADFQKPRITDKDCEVLKVFKGQDELLLALRNVLFGIENERERAMVDGVMNDNVKRVLYKFFLPQIDREDPVGESQDLWKTQDIGNATLDTFKQVWQTKELLIEMIEIAMEYMENPNVKRVDLTPRNDLVFLTARNNFIDFVSSRIRDIVMNAHRESETVEQMMERMRKDSSK